MEPMDLSKIELGDISTNNGTKIIPLSIGGKPLFWIPKYEMKVMYEPRGFDDLDGLANRVSVCFEVCESTEKLFKGLDDKILSQLSQYSMTYFGKSTDKSELRDLYMSSIRTSSKGIKTLRVKMVRAGHGSVSYWNEKKEPSDPPNDWTTCTICPRFLIRGLWMNGKQSGMVIELKDVMFTETAVCPF
jgi:hypothetical protein